MKVGGQIPWNVTPICETSQIYYLMGRRPVKGGSGIPFNGRVVAFGAPKDLSRLHQFGPQVLPGIFLGYVLSAGKSGKET